MHNQRKPLQSTIRFPFAHLVSRGLQSVVTFVHFCGTLNNILGSLRVVPPVKMTSAVLLLVYM